MHISRKFLVLLPMILLARPAPAQEAAQELAMDTPTQIGGIEAVCTGVSLDAREDPRWAAYGLKVEIAGAGGRYLAEETIAIRQGGKTLLTAGCKGPWMMFRLPPGRYEVEARLGEQSATSAAFVPASGQGRIILRFADAPGEPAASSTAP